MDKWHYKQWQHSTLNSIFIVCFYFHQKTALLSLFQTTFFPLHACCCCCSFFLCPAIRQSKACMPNAGWTQKMLKASHSARWGSWLMYTLLWAMQVWICGRVTAWEGWWSPSFWVKPAQQHPLLSRARGRMGKGPHVCEVQFEVFLQAGGPFPLQILAAHREAASVVSSLLSWVIFQGMEPVVWAPWGRPAPSTGSTRLHPKRRRRGTLHPNPIISGELQHLKWFMLHKVHSLH